MNKNSFIFIPVTDRPNKNSPSLMPWEVFQTQMPWGVLLHIGAGFSLANSIEKSGLSEYLISKLSLFSVMNIYILLASLVFSTLVTIILAELIPPEVVCNVALMIVMQWVSWNIFSRNTSKNNFKMAACQNDSFNLIFL